MDEHEIEDFVREEMAHKEDLKKKLKTARPEDFQVVHVGEPYPYAASLYGCYDIAVFKRKEDCERFIATFASEGVVKDE